LTPTSRNRLWRGARKFNRQIWRSHQQALADKMAGQISAVAVLVPGVEDVETQVVLNESGEVESMHLLVKPQPLATADESVR